MIIKPSQPGATSTQATETTSATKPSAAQESAQQFAAAMHENSQSSFLEKFAKEHPDLKTLLDNSTHGVSLSGQTQPNAPHNLEEAALAGTSGIERIRIIELLDKVKAGEGKNSPEARTAFDTLQDILKLKHLAETSPEHRAEAQAEVFNLLGITGGHGQTQEDIAVEDRLLQEQLDEIGR